MANSNVILSNTDSLKLIKEYVALALEHIEEILELYPEEEDNLITVLGRSDEFIGDFNGDRSDQLLHLLNGLATWHSIIINEDNIWEILTNYEKIHTVYNRLLVATCYIGRAYELSSITNWGEFKKK